MQLAKRYEVGLLSYGNGECERFKSFCAHPANTASRQRSALMRKVTSRGLIVSFTAALMVSGCATVESVERAQATADAGVAAAHQAQGTAQQALQAAQGAQQTADQARSEVSALSGR